MKRKSFIITIDTEGDNLWDWKEGTEIGTNNSRYIPRFQSLCNEFGFKPTWLTNWEMIQNQEYVEFVKGNGQQDIVRLVCICMHGIRRLFMSFQ